MKRILMLIVCAAFLAGCANSRCKGELDYQKAYSLPETEVAGIKLSNQASALVIPPAPDKIVPYGQPYTDAATGKPKLQCLDSPPPKS